MEHLTLFDSLTDKVLWRTTYCNWCDYLLPRRDELVDDEIAIRAYQGQHGHMVFLGYHAKCYLKWAETETDIDKIFKEIT